MKLIENKSNIEICSKNMTPKSLQMEDVVEAGKVLGKKGNAKDLTTLFKDWRRVFANRVALGLSFRRAGKEMAPDFLQTTPDLDFDALDALANFSRKSREFAKILNRAVVKFEDNISWRLMLLSGQKELRRGRSWRQRCT
eukprot:TRINITY_DN3187_c0_g4_i1.p2 TRINITY_DN3187_c0_g4~~TRINITY_DN3187_c0_g4_i1.p2  ORF type:complete len:140 (-),score=20.34 TRINITY_DN3187_c0_g4_i1:164-583(-)